jgi:hypothetical protein
VAAACTTAEVEGFVTTSPPPAAALAGSHPEMFEQPNGLTKDRPADVVPFEQLGFRTDDGADLPSAFADVADDAVGNARGPLSLGRGIGWVGCRVFGGSHRALHSLLMLVRKAIFQVERERSILYCESD